MNTRTAIEAFLHQRRLAFVGVSRNPKDFSRTLFREFQRRGYSAIPVNPNATAIEGVPCYPSLAAIPNGVPAALLLVKPESARSAVEDCATARVRHLWLYGASQSRKLGAPEHAFCDDHGISVVEGECPFMFLSDAAFPHRFHGACRKLLRQYPA